LANFMKLSNSDVNVLKPVFLYQIVYWAMGWAHKGHMTGGNKAPVTVKSFLTNVTWTSLILLNVQLKISPKHAKQFVTGPTFQNFAKYRSSL